MSPVLLNDQRWHEKKGAIAHAVIRETMMLDSRIGWKERSKGPKASVAFSTDVGAAFIWQAIPLRASRYPADTRAGEMQKLVIAKARGLVRDRHESKLCTYRRPPARALSLVAVLLGCRSGGALEHARELAGAGEAASLSDCGQHRAILGQQQLGGRDTPLDQIRIGWASGRLPKRAAEVERADPARRRDLGHADRLGEVALDEVERAPQAERGQRLPRARR